MKSVRALMAWNQPVTTRAERFLCRKVRGISASTLLLSEFGLKVPDFGPKVGILVPFYCPMLPLRAGNLGILVLVPIKSAKIAERPPFVPRKCRACEILARPGCGITSETN